MWWIIGIFFVCLLLAFSHIFFSAINNNYKEACIHSIYHPYNSDIGLICTHKDKKNKESGSACLACEYYQYGGK